MVPRNLRKTLALIIFVLLLAGCDSGAQPTAIPSAAATPTTTGDQPQATTQSSTTPGTAGKASPTPDKAHPTKVTIALGYNPDIQFAPFYLALNKGYYLDQGLDVTFKHGIVTDLFTQLGEGSQGIDFAVASGDEVIPAKLQGIPVIYVMTWYRQYPVAAASIVGKGPSLKAPADLKGHIVGVPGPYGATYIGLQALLKAGGLTMNDINLKSIGFTQIENLTSGQVDAAMVYAANEPTQLRSQGLQVDTLNVSDFAKLASNGLVTTQNMYRDNPLVIARVIQATQKGIQETIHNPSEAFQQSLKQVPEAGGANADTQQKVLTETIKLMQPLASDPAQGHPICWTDVDVWSATQDLLYDIKVISQKGKIAEMFTNRFIPTQGQ